MIMITTLLAAILIPPVGLMDPKQFNKNSKTLDDDAAATAPVGDADNVKVEPSNNDKKKKQKHIKGASKTSTQKKKSQ